MFQVATKHLAKVVGYKTLHPVTDLNSSERFQTMCVLKKKRSFWIWKEPKLVPTQITMQDLFSEDLDLPKPTTEVILENYTETPSVKISGSLGADLMEKFHLKLDAIDSADLTISLGAIEKAEMDWEGVYEVLLKSKLKLDHPLLSEVRNSPRTSLCIVLESISTKSKGDLKDVNDTQVSTDDGGGIAKSFISINVTTKDKVEKKIAHTTTIPPSTVLAYSCNEFSVNNEGSAAIHSTFDTFDSTDGGIPSEEMLEKKNMIKRELEPLVNSRNVGKIRNKTKDLLGVVTNGQLSALHLILYSIEFSLEQRTKDKHIHDDISSSIRKYLKEMDPSGAMEWIFQYLGFGFERNNEDAPVEFSGVDLKILKCFIALVDSLEDVELSVRTLLSSLSYEHLKFIYNVIESELGSKENVLESSVVRQLYEDPTSQLLLKHAGFVDMVADGTDMLCYSGNKTTDLMDLFTVCSFFSD